MAHNLSVFVLEKASERKLQKAFKQIFAKIISTLEDASTDKSISKILELLDDGEWHSLDEVQRKTRLNHQNLKKAIEFLAKYNFVVVDEHSGRVRLSEVYLKTLLHKSL